MSVCVAEVVEGIVTRLSGCINLPQMGGFKITRWDWSPGGEEKKKKLIYEIITLIGVIPNPYFIYI